MKLSRPQSRASWSIFIFGVLAFVLGVIGLIRPEITLGLLGFEAIDRAARATGDYTLVFIIASSMASVNMGIYYMLASLTNLRAFFWWTVPFRILTFAMFTYAVGSGLAPANLIAIAVWELAGALITGAALFYERGQRTTTPPPVEPIP
jgi:hypothetical protein